MRRRKRSFLASAATTITTLLFLLHAHALTMSQQKIAVIGSTGKLGRETVNQLASLGIPTRCLLRHNINGVKPSIEEGASSKEVAAYLATLPGIEMVKGDITDPESISELLKGCTACLALQGASRTLQLSDLWKNPESEPNHAKQVNYVGITNLISAVQNSDSCKRIVRITGKGEDPWGIFSILINMLGGMAKAWNYEGEELLRQSGVDYTIIRPGVMRPIPPPDDESRAILQLADNGGDLKVSPVSYSQIATLCIECLKYNNAKKCTLCAMNVPDGEGETSYGPLLQKVRPDTRQFPKSLMKEHRLAVRTGGAALLALFGSGVAVSLFVIRSIVGFLFGK